jgi:hypothetical protein
MEKIDSLAKINQVEINYCKNLFLQFTTEIPSFYQGRTIPFSFCYFWFSHKKLNRSTARAVISIWVQKRWCIRRKYHGLIIREDREECNE